MAVSPIAQNRPAAADIHELGVNITCDNCEADLTNSVRIKCADPECDDGESQVDICPSCFCYGKEFKKHKRTHAYRVIELPSYPIYTEDWGADEELLLIDGALLQGIGNWQGIAKHVGTRTPKEVEEHYKKVYIESSAWPLPTLSVEDEIDMEDFRATKRRRIEALPAANAAAAPKPAPTSAPGFHEVSTFLPGRLEFEHELDNDAEELIKDLQFGLVSYYGGDEMPEDENDLDIQAKRQYESRSLYLTANGIGHSHPNSASVEPEFKEEPEEITVHSPSVNGAAESKEKDKDTEKDKDKGGEEEKDVPLPLETEDSIAFKLTLLEMYANRVEKRHEAKAFIFERGLLEYRKTQAQEKKRQKEEKELIYRYRPFAKLQTADDYEQWVDGMLYESTLRKRIAALQNYRRMGLTTLADAEKYEADVVKRIQVKTNINTGREYSFSDRRGAHPSHRGGSHPIDTDPRASSRDRESTPLLNGAAVNGNNSRRGLPAPLNLASAPSLSLLSPAEQTICSSLRILPKPYLTIKETLIGAYLKSGGTLRKRDARELARIDVNKSGRLWDFFQQSGWFKTPDQPATSENDKMDIDPDLPHISLNSSSATLVGPGESGSQSVPPMMNGIHDAQQLPHTSASAGPEL